MIKCPICKKEFKAITNNHLKKHSINLNKFKELYPNFNLVSKEIKSALSKGASERAKKGWKTYKENNDSYSIENRIKNQTKHSKKRNQSISKGMKEKWKNEDFQKSVSNGLNNSEKFQNHLKTLHKKIKNKDTSIEIKVKEQLIYNDIDFETQKVVKDSDISLYAIADFYLPSYNLIIECNGDFWHCNPKVYIDGPVSEVQVHKINKDKIKLEIYQNNNYKFLTLWELDIKKENFDILSYLQSYSESE